MSTDESGVKTSAVAEPEGTEPSQELPTLPPTTSSVLPPTPPQSSSGYYCYLNQIILRLT